MRAKLIEKKRLSTENQFTIPDVISFAIFGREYATLKDKNRFNEILVLMEFLGFVTEKLYMTEFRTRAEACTNLRKTILNPLAILENDFLYRTGSIAFLMTPRICIIDSGKEKYHELKKSVQAFLDDPNFSPKAIHIVTMKDSSNLEKLKRDFSTKLALVEHETITEGGDFSQVQEKLITEYPDDTFLIVSTLHYTSQISSPSPQIAIYGPNKELTTTKSLGQTRELASELYLDKILRYTERNSVDNATDIGQTRDNI